MTLEDIKLKMIDKRIMAYSKLLGIADFLNGSTPQEWSDIKFILVYANSEYTTVGSKDRVLGGIYFKTYDIAESALKELGSSLHYLYNTENKIVEDFPGNWKHVSSYEDIKEIAIELLKLYGEISIEKISETLDLREYTVDTSLIDEVLKDLSLSLALAVEIEESKILYKKDYLSEYLQNYV